MGNAHPGNLLVQGCIDIADLTQTVQAHQRPTGEGLLSANKEVEIRSLKTEIDILKKQIAGRT